MRLKLETVEYSKPKPTVIYYALNGKEVIGSSTLYKVDYFKPLKAYEVSMTRVLPEYRGKHIAQKLFDKFLKDKNPDIVCGFTNSPLGVLYRTKSCRRNKMRNFFGYFDLDKKVFDYSGGFYSKILSKYLKFKKVKSKKDIHFYLKNGSLERKPSELAVYPIYIKNAFKDVVNKQKAIGDKKTVVYPFINIKKSLFKLNE